MVREVARARAEEGEPVPFHLVLQDDTLGLAALRARLDAAGARYAELAGWDAEEPSAGTAVSARSALSGGPVDEVDLAAGTAVSTVDGVRELRRAWEEFRGGAGGPVRVYVPVLGGPVDLVAVAGALSATVAAAGACCVVVPVPADPRARRRPPGRRRRGRHRGLARPCRARAGGRSPPDRRTSPPGSGVREPVAGGPAGGSAGRGAAAGSGSSGGRTARRCGAPAAARAARIGRGACRGSRSGIGSRASRVRGAGERAATGRETLPVPRSS